MKKVFCILYSISVSLSQIKAQSANVNFESTSPGTYTTANAVTGWTISSQTASTCNTSTVWNQGSPEFSIVATPVISFPTIGTIPNSPLGGTNIARLNNSTANGSITKIAHTIPVTFSNTVLQIAFAGIANDGHALCCEQSGFKIHLKDQFGANLACASLSLVPGVGCQSAGVTFTVTSLWSYWTNWQVKYIDLSPYVNSNITLEITSNDCTYGDHFGTFFVDATVGPQLFGSGLTTINNPTSVCPAYYCSGSNQAQLFAPIGYAYQWFAPITGSIAAPQGNQSSLVVPNPMPGSVYTVQLTTPAGCVYLATSTIVPTTVGIAAIGSSSSCAGGASGSATVIGSGSGTGYNYTWLNSTSTVVSTFSVISNLAPGTYSVKLTALGSAGCGSAVTTVTVNSAPAGTINLVKSFCGIEAYLNAGNGSNYQWYNNTTLIPAGQGGTASSYTVNPATNGNIYWLSYISSMGCKDSVQYTLVSVPPGSLGISYNPKVCPGATNGLAVVSITPAMGSPSGINSFSVFSTGTSTPVYSASLNPTNANTFTASNLSASGTYSVNAFDGTCKYSTSFSVTPFVFNYTLSQTSPTLCPGNNLAVSVTFSSPVLFNQFTYSWSPTTFLAGGFGGAPTTIITPTTAPGIINTIIYTVVVTPTLVNCPLIKTLSVTAANPLAPVIAPIPDLCSNSPNYLISATPPGGIFINGTSQSIGTGSGILSPSLAAIGVNTFTYASSVGTCVAKSSGSFNVHASPIINVSGNTSICQGQSTTLLAGGANTFTWSDNTQGPLLTLSPGATSSYTVVGMNAATSCTDNAVVTVTIFPAPAITVSGNSLICLGESATLTAGGANTYSWSNGFSGQTIIVSPLTNNSYTVYGTSAQGCSDSKMIGLNVSACVGIGEGHAGTGGLTIYPNPTSGQLFVETANTITLIMYDELGRIAKEERIIPGQHPVNLAGLNDGIYLLRIIQNEKIQTVRIVKTQ